MSKVEDVKKFRQFLAEAYDYELAMLENNITQDDVDNFREILRSSDKVPRAIMNKALLMVLIRCNKNIDKSVNLAETYVKMHREAIEFFGNRDVESKEVQHSFDHQIHLPLPPTPDCCNRVTDNCNVILHKLATYEPKNYIFDYSEKAFLMTVGMLMK